MADQKENGKTRIYLKVPVDEALEVDTIATTNSLDAEVLEAEKVTRNDMIGFLLGAFSAISTAVSAGCVQSLKGHVPHFELNMLRFLSLAIFSVFYFVGTRQIPQVKLKDALYVFIYDGLIVCQNLAIYICVTILPLGTVGAVGRIGGMILAIPLALIFLKERITLLKVTGALLGSVGVFLVCKADIFGEGTEDVVITDNSKLTLANSTTVYPVNISTDSADMSPESVESNLPIWFGYILVVINAVTAVTCGIVQISKLPHVNPMVLCFWLGILGTLSSLLLALIFETMIFPYGLWNWIFILGHCIGTLLHSVTAIIGQTYASAVIMQLAHSTQIFFFFVAQYFFLQHIFPSGNSWIEILGAILSVISVTMVPAIQIIQVKCKKKQ